MLVLGISGCKGLLYAVHDVSLLLQVPSEYLSLL